MAKPMKTIDEYLNRKFSKEELTAIGELIKMAELMTEKDGTPISPMHQMLGAMFMERAANIVRKEAEPFVADMKYVRAFSEFWDVSKRAEFNEQ